MLTDERILELLNEWFRREKGGDTYADCWNACARAIEAEVLQEQEPVAWFAFADNNGPVPLELWGFDEKACKHAVIESARSVGWKGTVEGYLMHMGWTIRPLVFIAPQPPVTCPKCENAARRSEYWKAEHQAANGTIHELQAKVAELEKVALAYEDQVAAHNKTLDEVARLSALIEKCEKALASAVEWGVPMRDAPKSSRPYWFDDSVTALAAIAAQKGGAA